MTEKWTLQDAKNRFSELVNRAVAGQPQRVTRRGQDAVVVVSARKYDQLVTVRGKAAGPAKPDFIQFLLNAPKTDFKLPRRTPWPKRKPAV